jgi:hypothetical protein
LLFCRADGENGCCASCLFKCAAGVVGGGGGDGGKLFWLCGGAELPADDVRERDADSSFAVRKMAWVKREDETDLCVCVCVYVCVCVWTTARKCACIDFVFCNVCMYVCMIPSHGFLLDP